MANVMVENQRTQQTGREPARTEQGRERPGGVVWREREGYFNPFSLMRRLSEELDRAFATSFGLPAWSRAEERETANWMPLVEVTERDNNLIVSAELPGTNRDDVKVELSNEGLVIQGERRREHEEKRHGYYRSERSYGHFYRLIPLPEDIDADKVKAQFKDGVLQVELPLLESARRKRREIPIKS
jgi:HSP20 family protein